MSTDSITIKANNHRVYQCPTEKKIELVNKIISENTAAQIVVACSIDASELREKISNKNVKIMEDRDLVKDKELRYELLISYDMPIKAIVYMARVSKATDKAFLLLDKSEQKELYSIEMLLGRAIKQEKVDGFEYAVIAKEYNEKPAYKKMSKDEIRDEAKKRYEADTKEAPKKVYDKSKDDYKSKDFKKKDSNSSDGTWAKKKKAPNKFLGKDDNGKAIFSGKDGERNHRHDGTPRGAYDAPKAGGRKINIKAIKPKESKES